MVRVRPSHGQGVRMVGRVVLVGLEGAGSFEVVKDEISRFYVMDIGTRYCLCGYCCQGCNGIRHLPCLPSSCLFLLWLFLFTCLWSVVYIPVIYLFISYSIVGLPKCFIFICIVYFFLFFLRLLYVSLLIMCVCGT